MRAKTSNILLASALKLMGHATMGVAMGLGFAFFVTRFDPLGIMARISDDAVPGMTQSVLVGIIVMAFGVGTTLTGFVFMITEDHR